MVYRVVSTKLTEDEHTTLLDECNREGCTPSSLIKEAILEKIHQKEKPTEENTNNKLIEELNEILNRN